MTVHTSSVNVRYCGFPCLRYLLCIIFSIVNPLPFAILARLTGKTSIIVTLKGEVKSHTSQGGLHGRSLSRFLHHEAAESIATSPSPLDEMLVHRRATPSSMSAVLIYTPGWRHPGVYMSTADILLGVALRWTSISSRGEGEVAILAI